MSNNRVQVEVEPSGLAAFVTVTEGDDEASDPESVLTDALAGAGVVFGVDPEIRDAVVDGLNDPSFTLDRTPIAFGIAPERGTDGTLQTRFEMRVQAGLPKDDGSLDYRDRNFLQAVRRGEGLATYLPPGPPTDGTGVDGKVMLAEPGADPVPKLGPGARLDDDVQVVADRDGIVRWDGTTGFDVVAYLKHDGDVDLSSGHLRMEGDLTVGGTVRDGFRVKATGNIEILGDVEGGLVSAGGDIAVKGAILGREQGLVSARGNLIARRAQNATVRSGGRVELQVDAIDSTVQASEVAVTGVVRGGVTEAETHVLAGDAGSGAAGAELAAAVLVEWPEDLLLEKVRLARLERSGRKARRGPERSRGGAARRRDSGERARAALRERARQKRLEQCESIARIDIRGRAREGVIIRFGTHRKVIAVERQKVRYRLDRATGTIRTEDLP